MASLVKLKVDDEQMRLISSVLLTWKQDHKLCDIVKLVDASVYNNGENGEVECVLTLKVSGEITYDIWTQFCQDIEMRIAFPGY